MEKRLIAKLVTAGFLLALVSMQPAHAACDDKRKPGMDWSGCKKINKWMNDSNFAGSRFDGANLTLSRIEDSDFTGASLVKANITRTSATNSRFDKASGGGIPGRAAGLSKMR